MKRLIISTILGCAISALAQLATNQKTHSSAKSPLDVTIATFDVQDAILRDGLSELSLKNVEGLHLGFEEIIRNNIQDDPREAISHFSLHLQDKTVREILDELCRSDKRYVWFRRRRNDKYLSTSYDG